MHQNRIIYKFLDCNVNIHPSVLKDLRQLCSSELDMDRILNITKQKGASIITPEFLDEIKKEILDEIKNGNEKKPEVIIKGRKKVIAEEYDADIKINHNKDITSKNFTDRKSVV